MSAVVLLNTNNIIKWQIAAGEFPIKIKPIEAIYINVNSKTRTPEMTRSLYWAYIINIKRFAFS